MMANVAKRSHKDSSDSEQEIKKRRYEESSEDEDEEDQEHDEEEEVEIIDAVRNAENATLPAGPGKWSIEDSHRLLISIMLLLPHCDVELYSEQEAQIDWEKVVFGSFSADQCREHWHELTKKVRLYRTMSDLVADALSLLPHPASSFQMIQKNNRRLNLKPNPIKKKSTLPKMVTNAFSLFMQEKMKALQHIPAVERMKHVSQMYKFLSESERNELKGRYDEMKRNHLKVLKKLKEDNPALAEEIDTQIKKLEKIPGTSKKTKSSVVNQNNSILKYMNKEKTTPAQTVRGSEKKESNPSSGRSPKKSASVKSASIPFKSKTEEDKSDQSSDDFTKKSAFKPQSNTAAEEEDSRASDSSENEEENNISSARSPQKSAPVISASRPHKSKAIVEKPSVTEHSGSEDERGQSTGDFRKKSASKPQSTKSAKEEDSGASEEEEKQRPKPQKKSHPAIPAEVSHKKKSVQLTSLKPASKPGNGLKPSQSKKKNKKKEDVVTGLSQFVTTKMATYRQIYPELNEREIVMKLAGKWERLSDKKKNKYEKLALKKMTSEKVD